jgi:ATP-dependent Clp protease, protease subunit
LLFQSTGGTVSDGVCLYNFFRSLPIGLTLYNSGSVASIAVIAYLGAKKRKVNAHATFMLHRTSAVPQIATAARVQSIAQSLTLDDKRTEAIITQHLTLSDEQWRIHTVTDLWLSAEEAVQCGLADEIGDFAPPPGQPVLPI